jgi:hypothetical protein
LAAAHTLRADVNQARHDGERSLMAKGIYSWAAHESREKAAELELDTR